MKNCLFQNLKNHGERNALHYIDKKLNISYSDILEEARQLTSFLKRQGIKKKDYVLTSFESEKNLLVSLLALSSLEAIMLPVASHVTNFELKKISQLLSFKTILRVLNPS
jgi:acyl-CoA synthetase (AMP-forming)/AMP-acid ligase II